jgi:hypothetical protein
MNPRFKCSKPGGKGEWRGIQVHRKQASPRSLRSGWKLLANIPGIQRHFGKAGSFWAFEKKKDQRGEAGGWIGWKGFEQILSRFFREVVGGLKIEQKGTCG